MNCQHTPAELGSDLVDLQNVDTERAMLEEERKHATCETAVVNISPSFVKFDFGN